MSDLYDPEDPFIENGQYMLEEDPEKPRQYLQAAKDAQTAKWRRLMSNRAPKKMLSLTELASSGSNPPLWRLGIPYTYEYMRKYAAHHHITIKIADAYRKYFDGKKVVDFADIDFGKVDDKDFLILLKEMVVILAVRHMGKGVNFSFVTGRPFSLDHEGIVSVFSNYDLEERFERYVRTPERYRRIEAHLQAAMSLDGEKKELEWWFDWENGVGLFTHLE